MSFMKKGRREDVRKQREVIKTQMASRLHKVPYLGGIAYKLADTSKDITINNIDSYLESVQVPFEIDDFDKELIIGEYNRVLVTKENEQRN